MRFKNSIPEEIMSQEGDAGARQPKGKSNMQYAVLRTGLQPKPETVKNAAEVPGLVRRCVDQQTGPDGNGSPKARPDNSWGVQE
jgi:hypothetical protein